MPIFFNLVRQYVDAKVRAPVGIHWQTYLDQRGEGQGDLRLGHPGGPLPDLINIKNAEPRGNGKKPSGSTLV